MTEDEASADNLSEVLKLGERAKKLISQILTFSRKTIITPENVDLKSLIEEVLKMLKATLPVNIEIKSDLGSSPVFIFADQGELYQLIMNLCVNAQLALCKNGGILQVILSKEKVIGEIEIGYQTIKPGNYAKLRVIDDGCGMEASIINRIFEPFFTTREFQKGTGLGLSVVHGIVNRYDGAVTVESEPDKGSTFTAYLPCSGRDTKEAGLSDQSANNSVARILLVDDEESIVNTVQNLLRRQGYTVHGVLDAREALKLFRENEDSFDIVLTDQSMPNMTGDALMQELRRIKPKLPIVICSGFSYEQPIENHDSLTAFLLKPASINNYINAIERLLNKKAVTVK